MLTKLATPLVIEIAEPATACRWDALYELDPLAMPTQSRRWAQAIRAASRSQNVSRYYRFSDGLEAVLPFYRRSIVPFTISVLNSPPPAWGFGGVLSSAPLTAAHLGSILDDCAQLSAAAISIRPNPAHASCWTEAGANRNWTLEPRRAHVLDLAGGFEHVKSTRFHRKISNKIRRALKHGVTVATGNSDALISDFDILFRRSIGRWANKQHEFPWLAQMRGRMRDPSRKFREMARQVGDLLQVGIARHNGNPVAGAMVLIGRNAHDMRGALDKQLIGNTYANYLLQSTMIELACRQQCRYYHLGESGNSRTLGSYKEQFGAVPVDYPELRFERLPVYSVDKRIRAGVKRLIGFNDV